MIFLGSVKAFAYWRQPTSSGNCLLNVNCTLRSKPQCNTNLNIQLYFRRSHFKFRVHDIGHFVQTSKQCVKWDQQLSTVSQVKDFHTHRMTAIINFRSMWILRKFLNAWICSLEDIIGMMYFTENKVMLINNNWFGITTVVSNII